MSKVRSSVCMTLTRALSSAVRSAEVKGVADDGDGELGAGGGEAGGGGDGKVGGLDDSGAEHDVNGDGGGGLTLNTHDTATLLYQARPEPPHRHHQMPPLERMPSVHLKT